MFEKYAWGQNELNNRKIVKYSFVKPHWATSISKSIVSYNQPSRCWCSERRRWRLRGPRWWRRTRSRGRCSARTGPRSLGWRRWRTERGGGSTNPACTWPTSAGPSPHLKTPDENYQLPVLVLPEDDLVRRSQVRNSLPARTFPSVITVKIYPSSCDMNSQYQFMGEIYWLTALSQETLGTLREPSSGQSHHTGHRAKGLKIHL